MKKLLLTLLLLLCAQFILAQQISVKHRNAIGVVLSPVDLGLGICYDVQLTPVSGIYSTLTKGEFHFGSGYIKDHVRAAVGYNLFSPKRITFLSIGVAYNWYGEVKNDPMFNPDVMKPRISAEFGFGAKIERFTTAVHIDPFKWESSVSLAYLFNYRRK